MDISVLIYLCAYVGVFVVCVLWARWSGQLSVVVVDLKLKQVSNVHANVTWG